LRTASFSYVSENQITRTPSNYAGVCLQNTYDYSPFGASLDERTVEGDFYRLGYQGSEKDDESKGVGNSYTTFFRQLDPRVGRWFSIDPKMSIWESPYVSMGNNPLLFNDKLGDTIKIYGGKGYVSPPHRTLYYVNGVVTDMNGQEYIKGGDFSNADNDKIIEDLEKIRNGGMEGAKLIDFFSNNNVSVSPNGSGSEFLINRNSINYPESYSPSIVLFTNDVALSPEVRNYRTFTDLAHELYHAQRFNQGILDLSPWNGTKVVRDEIWATHGENKIRNENGLPLRTHYGRQEESPNVYKPGLSLFDEIKVKTIVNFTYQGKHLMKDVISTPYDYNNPQENTNVTKPLDNEINNFIRAFSMF
jgi:RHS repeat-associated protein